MKSEEAAPGVQCHVCGGSIVWAVLEDCAKAIPRATPETVRSAILYGLVEVRHPGCKIKDICTNDGCAGFCGRKHPATDGNKDGAA